MGGNETRSEPFKSVLANGTVPEYHNGCPETAQTAQYPGLLVYKSSTLSENATTLCTAYYGYALDGEAEIFIIEIPRSNPAFPKTYDKSTAFPVSLQGSTYQMHRIKVGDQFWVKGSSISADASDLLVCASAGLVQAPGTSGAADKFNAHTFRPVATFATATWVLVEYVGMLSHDTN